MPQRSLDAIFSTQPLSKTSFIYNSHIRIFFSNFFLFILWCFLPDWYGCDRYILMGITLCPISLISTYLIFFTVEWALKFVFVHISICCKIKCIIIIDTAAWPSYCIYGICFLNNEFHFWLVIEGLAAEILYFNLIQHVYVTKMDWSV
jgi:hypothetical protein